MNLKRWLHPGFHLRKRVAAAYQEHIDYRRAAALRMWLAFIVTFAVLRFITYGIRYHFLPLGNVVTGGGLHIHHFVWGILILLLVGFLGITSDSPRLHVWLSTLFGIGAALVVDEFALWLNLRDVYWLKQGRLSIDAAILVAGLLGLYYAAYRFWNQVAREVRAAIKFVGAEEGRVLRRRPAAK
ncbi:MAG TPA: hypothetical protein VIT43_03180 [Candidatus Dormibacteraeota bacterium]